MFGIRRKFFLIHILFCTFFGAQGFVNSPKIITKDGNLIFESGQNRNISFRLNGASRLNINDEFDLLELLRFTRNGAGWRNTTIREPGGGWHYFQEDVDWRAAAADVVALKLRVFGAEGLDKRLWRLQNRTRGTNQQVRRFQIRLQEVETKVQTMYDRLELDNCKSNPCENGGTCFNLFNGFVCKCNKNFEGSTCDKDVNECALFTGTDLGCQNGAQCVNQFGGYNCICTPGWFGIHCTQRKGDCLQSSAWELCGHGTCVSNNDNFGYKCVCDQGWKTNGLTPACSVDVDECSESHPPCATRCINLPGSFTCAPCAAGLTGSGVNCRDIDECASQNGGCSLNPRVSCINSYGSFHCGECPFGWTGDGRSCTRNTNNNNDGNDDSSNGNGLAGTSCVGMNICHPDAICSEVSNTIVCTCPLDMIGSGIGVNGCIRGVDVNCNSSPCLNGGTCIDRDGSYVCLCPRGYRAPNCMPLASPCLPNPCKNSGRCVPGVGSEFECQCPAGYTGRLCNTRFSRCGGILTGRLGRFKYPAGDLYEHSAQCAWVIRTNETFVLNVTFNAFELEDSTECRFDWLQINDGRTAAAQIIGRFCGTHKPMGGNIISTTNHLYLWFRSDNSTARAGFDLSWNSIPPMCGGLINFETHGTIKTPGSPGNYPKNRDCRWQLRAPNTKRIKLTFFSLQIENHDSCNFDYVEITDAISGVVLEIFCNSSHPSPLTLPTNEADIHFHSDNEGGDTGFQIYYSTEQRVPDCGGVFTAKEATIRSPSFIQESISCEYDIKMASGESIKFEFTKFEMGAEDCVEVYDLHTGKQIRSLQGRYCGGFDTKVALFSSLYNALQLKFYSKGGTFELKYKADCSFIFESSSDVITSPNYPQIGNTERLCSFKISTEPDTVISLNFVDFDLMDTSSQDNDCAFTNLKLKDGLGKEELGPYCSKNNPPPREFVSKTSLLTIEFQSAITSSGRGFKIEYRSVPVDKTSCGGIFTKPGYSIRLPTGDDGHYMHDMICYWVIMAPLNRGILLTWKSFKLEESSDCTYDYVEVYDNLADSENDKPLGRYCDTRPPPALLSHSRILTLKFVSDSSDAMDGFEVSYDFINYSHNCGGEIFSSSGELNSPEWPLNYTNGLDCVWTITAPPSTQIELQIDTFELEQADKCGNDWLEIRNGGSSNSSLVGFYCGKTIPRLIPSFTNQMRLHFHSDGFINARGFKMKWYIFSNGCGGNLNTDLGVITSPLYPNAYPNNAQCEWRVNVNKGSSIHFTIEDLEMEDLFQCNYDHLDIYDGRSNADTTLTRICRLDADSPRQFVTSGNEALVRFTTDSSNTERGFFISYYANCSRTITALHGAIESPNYGNSYRRSSVNCTWTIKAPRGNRIYLEFTHFDASEGSQIYLTDLAKNGSIQHVLMQGLSYNSTGDTLIVKQNSSLVVFRLEYTMVGCINAYHRETGEISSPNFPRTYPNDIECVWEISTGLGQGIELIVRDLDIEESVNCTHDGLIISSETDSKNPKERHCGKQERISLISGGHRLFLRFYSDAASNGKGFHATYSTVKSTCGGEVRSKNGVIQSPNYPQNYPASADCEWIVTVSSYHTITFTIEELDLERYYDCEMDYVELYEYIQDGTADDDKRKLFRKCGELENESNVFTTTSNTAVIRFKSDDSEQYKGFKLSFKENCGGRIIIDDDDFIDYIGVTRHGQQNETCLWQLISKDVTKHVMFETNHVQLNPAVALSYKTEADCLDQGVKVFNGDDDTAPLQTKFCTTHPPTIISNGHALTIKVPLNIISEFEGYFMLMNSFCGNRFFSLRGKFATPHYPSTYPTGIECVWVIQATEGNAIALTIESIDLEQSDGCNNDYLEVRETDERGRLLGIFCGNSLPPTLESSSSLWIKFRSDGDNVGTGFLASYNYVMHNELTGVNGTIESPRYPTKFAVLEPYSWRITVDREYVVLVTISHIYDVDVPFIKFYDGYSDIGAQIDYTNTHNVRSNTNILYLTATRGPFQFEWQQLSKEAIRSNRTAEEKAKMCGTEIVSVDNVLIFNSPGYPNGYEANMDCSWTLVPSNPAKHVVFQLNKIDLEDFSSCMADSLSVSSSSDLQQWHHLGKHCKKSPNTNEMYEGKPYLKLDFVTDASVNKIGFSAFLHTACGSELTSRSALVNISELSKGMSMFKVDCVWTIRVRQGHRIRIYFPESYLHSPNDTSTCRSYFLVRNGIDNDSPFLGKGNYCENDINHSLETTSNRAYIKFISSGFPKFKAAFYYEEIAHECSDDVVLSDASTEERTKTITTPKYPNIPNPHSECIWKIVAPINHVIALNFIGTFDLATGTAPITASCDREYVQINDGATELMPLLGRYCGNTKPDTIYSTGNQMRIKYFTDIGEPHMGFMANVSIGRCGGSYYTSEGVINSPVDLKMRSNEQEMECVYTIELPPGNTINLTMDNIDLPDSSDCATVTHLELQEIYMYGDSGDADNITDILRICGHVPKRYIVETNKLVIRYKIKGIPTETTDRFKMSYSSIGSRCGETIQASQGILQTPGYPGGVNNPTHCLWRILVPKGRRIKIEFLDFDTGSVGNVTNFGYDDIRRFRGRLSFANDFQMQSIIARVTNNPPTQLYSTDNTMAIDAFLLSFSMHRGFKLRFTSYERSEVCGSSLDRLSNGEGTVQFKRENDTSIYCSYSLKMLTNETLVLHVEKYDKYSEYLSNNYCALVTPLKIEFNSKDLLPGLLCKNETQPTIRLPFPATLKLSGNKRNKLRELQLQYQVYKCGGILNILPGDNLTITQPQMVDQNGGRLECAWAVWPNGEFDVDHISDLDFAMEEVQLVVELATDLKGSCEDEYLLLYNGPDQNAPLLGRFCQQSTASNIVVEHGLFFEYVTQNYDLKSTFNLSISQGSGCGGKLTYPYRSIIFMEEYKNNAECIWEIVAEPGFHLGLSFVGRFFIESSPECKKDYLRVQQKDARTGDWVNLDTLCGREPPAAINTTTTEMRLIFRSDAETVGDGFTARFERNCGGILYASNEKRTLESPGYPIKYGNNLLCNYTILPENPSSAGILVRFLDFDLEQAPVSTCMFDNVTVYIKDGFKSIPETVICGTKSALEFRAKEKIAIVLRTDTSFTYKGFQLEYSINICGAVITNSSRIETPHQNHDSNYPASSSCYWNLSAPIGYKIMIKFEELDFEAQMSCIYDGVEIFQGLVPVADQRLGKFCGNLTGHLPTLSIPSNTGLIHSFSDDQDSSRGFSALINFMPNCDRQIFLDTSNASYTFNTYAGGYENNLDCSYVFSTKPGRQLQIQFSNFHVEETENCADDYLEVRDGAGPFADAIGIFCGHVIPEILMSSQNVVFLHFVSDSQVTSTGFEAIIKSIPLQCGDHTLHLNGTQKIELKSPDNGNGKYLPNLSCFWKIKSENNIHIQFEKLDIQGPNAQGECNNDLLKFYNSEDAEKIESGFGSTLIFNGLSGSNDAYSYALQHIFCGNHVPDDYFASSKEIFVKFQTDSTVEKSGFKLIASVAMGCFRNFTGIQGRIMLAETTDHCDIFIKAPANYSLSLYYGDLTFSEADCTKEYLEVFEPKTNTSLQKNCEYISTGRSLFTHYNELRLRIRMSGFYSQFDITYLASSKGPGCGGDLYNTAGVITSPFYPNNMRESSDCEWNIRVPSNVKVLLKFEVFDMGARTTCHSDYLQIVELNMVVRQFCGEDQPVVYKSTKSALTIRFRKTVNYDGTGWVIQFNGVYSNYKIPEHYIL